MRPGIELDTLFMYAKLSTNEIWRKKAEGCFCHTLEKILEQGNLEISIIEG